MTLGRTRRGALAALVLIPTAVAAYVGVKLVFAGPPPTTFSSADLVSYYYPMLRYGFAQLSHLHVPLWTPYQSAGTPFLANPHIAFLYPPYAPFLFLPADTAVTIDIIIHLTIAAVGTWMLAVQLGLGTMPALLAAAVYVFQGAMAIKVFYPEYLAGVAWIPALLCLVDRTLESGSPRTAAALAAVAGVAMLGGNLQYLYFTALALVPFVLARGIAIARREGASILPRRVTLLAAAGAIAVMLALIRLVPAAEYMRQTWRPPGGLSLDIAAVGSIPPALFLRNLLVPLPGEDVLRQGYVGILPMVLAVGGLCSWQRRSVSMPMGIIVVATALYAFGTSAPVFPFLYRLPGGAWFRGPARALVFSGLGIGMLAAAGLQVLLAAEERRARAVAALAVVAVALLLTVVAGSLGLPGWPLVAAYCGASVLAIAALGHRIGRPLAVVAIVLLSAFDLVHAQRPEGVLPSRLQGRFGRYEAIFAEIRARQGLDRTYIRTDFAPGSPLDMHSDLAKAGLVHGIWQATDYESLCPERLDGYLGADTAHSVFGSFCYWPVRLTRETMPLLALMGVRFYVLEDLPLGSAPGDDLDFTGWRLLRRVAGVRLYENPDVLPRAFIASRAEERQDRGAVVPALRRSDVRHLAFVEGTLDSPLEGDPRVDAGSATVTEYAADRVLVRAHATVPGLLVLTDNWDAGWTARRDGTPVPIHRTDYLFRGVELPAGEHVVEFTYRPRSFLIGAAGSALGLAAIVGLIARREREHRSSPT